MKSARIIFFILVIILLSAGILVNQWAATPHERLDLKLGLLLKYIHFKQVDLFEEGRSPEQIRAYSARSSKILKAEPVKIRTVKPMTIPGHPGPISIRLYHDRKTPAQPIVIYCHGGGWVMGDLDSHDNICRKIAKKANAIVIAVDYRLAPEHPFPGAVEDVYSALEWTWDNGIDLGGDPSKIFLAGDSAGGNLAAVAAIEARNLKGPDIAGQILIYPATDLSILDTDSYQNFAQGYYLTHRYMEKFRAYYLPNPLDRINFKASPLLEPSLKNLAPAMVITAEFDVLRDEGKAYADRLQKAGIHVKHIQVKRGRSKFCVS
ncbi:MAG: alpha/beta hydrolase [Desulfobacter sp.]|nr:alpha/beta hydrolase [Desulfobacter sp.]WDP87456.1 MAG: alpha/beta hydrolase [Desulfobacter sp.]